jgi:hypothetical protein
MADGPRRFPAAPARRQGAGRVCRPGTIAFIYSRANATEALYAKMLTEGEVAGAAWEGRTRQTSSRALEQSDQRTPCPKPPRPFALVLRRATAGVSRKDGEASSLCSDLWEL